MAIIVVLFQSIYKICTILFPQSVLSFFPGLAESYSCSLSWLTQCPVNDDQLDHKSMYITRPQSPQTPHILNHKPSVPPFPLFPRPQRSIVALQRWQSPAGSPELEPMKLTKMPPAYCRYRTPLVMVQSPPRSHY